MVLNIIIEQYYKTMPYPSPVLKEKNTVVCYKNIKYVKYSFIEHTYAYTHTPKVLCIYNQEIQALQNCKMDFYLKNLRDRDFSLVL